MKNILIVSLFKARKPIYLLVFCLLLSCIPTGNESKKINPLFFSKLKDNTVKFDLKDIRKRGTLRALVDNSSISYFIYKGRLMGYEYELLNLLSKDLGVKLELILTSSIDEAFEKLDAGKGDIMAFPLTVTKERMKEVSFIDGHYTTRQVLVQRKPRNWYKLKKHELENLLVRNQVDLIGKEIHVRKSSSYAHRLKNLSDEIGGDIMILEGTGDTDTETMIKKVSSGEIEYTVADEDMALVNASYYSNIDVATPISFPQQISWAIRKNSKDLLGYTNSWFNKIKRGPTYNSIYNKYFKSHRASMRRVKSDYSTLTGNRLSKYDELIKERAKRIGWDWTLLASQIYQESRFDPTEKSWAGAIGLMQLVPETGNRFGAKNLYNPKESILAGTKFLMYLDSLWSKTVKNKEERIKFVLASYNVGLGHVVDARELTRKFGGNPLKWENHVERYLLRKSKPSYFMDPVCKSGYCRGEEPVNYVKDILDRHKKYNQLISVREGIAMALVSPVDQ